MSICIQWEKQIHCSYNTVCCGLSSIYLGVMSLLVEQFMNINSRCRCTARVPIAMRMAYSNSLRMKLIGRRNRFHRPRKFYKILTDLCNGKSHLFGLIRSQHYRYYVCTSRILKYGLQFKAGNFFTSRYKPCVEEGLAKLDKPAPQYVTKSEELANLPASPYAI